MRPPVDWTEVRNELREQGGTVRAMISLRAAILASAEQLADAVENAALDLDAAQRGTESCLGKIEARPSTELARNRRRPR